MTDYQAPLNDMKFLLHSQSNENFSDLYPVLEEAARFVENVLAPANAPGDQQGCGFNEGQVHLPSATRDAFQQYVEGGWMGISMPEAYGGQALPEQISSKVSEMLTSTNNALCMIPALTMSACKALIAFASEDLKTQFLPKLVSGNWTGTMCLTEPHAGSDLGLIKSTAVAVSDTEYRVSGSKIFISAGEHDGSENIVHLVLARLKDSPAGIKGLSLFLVPKYLDPAAPASRNAVHCIGIEEKMGIHANPTCTMSFEEATGFLIGRPNEGIKAMFTMMNEMRLGTALQGVGLSEHAFQKSYGYAIERVQGKTLDKQQQTDAAADPLLMHADVRRMLLTQKAFAEGGRALCHYCAQLLDDVKTKGENQAEAEKLLGLLTPIAKAFLTETGLESASHAIQVYGGHGYIQENGVEQLYRDGRISTLYEGTTGIQSLDLLGRKVLGDQAQTLLLFTKQIYRLCKQITEDDSSSSELKTLAEQLAPFAKEWPQLAQQIGMKALQNHEEVGAAAFDFLMYSGYVCLGFFWLKMAKNAVQASSDPQNQVGLSDAFYRGKLKTASFYFGRILPRTSMHKATMLSGKQNLTSHDEDEWCFQ